MRILIFVGLISIALASCTQRTICPAYQSAFIYDKEELRKKFSYFNEDMDPRLGGKAKKNKFLIAEPVTYQKKVASLNTVPMKAVGIVVPDSMRHASERSIAADLDKAARTVIDSTYIPDSSPVMEASAKSTPEIYMISVDKEHHILKYDPIKREYRVDSIKYNVDQDNYMWYLRKEIVLPDTRIAAQEAAEAKKAEEKAARKGLFGFLKKDKSEKEKAPRQRARDNKPVAVPKAAEEDTPLKDEEEDDGF